MLLFEKVNTKYEFYVEKRIFYKKRPFRYIILCIFLLTNKMHRDIIIDDAFFYATNLYKKNAFK